MVTARILWRRRARTVHRGSDGADPDVRGHSHDGRRRCATDQPRRLHYCAARSALHCACGVHDDDSVAYELTPTLFVLLGALERRDERPGVLPRVERRVWELPVREPRRIETTDASNKRIHYMDCEHRPRTVRSVSAHAIERLVSVCTQVCAAATQETEQYKYSCESTASRARGVFRSPARQTAC